MKIEYHPIGIVHSPFEDVSGDARTALACRQGDLGTVKGPARVRRGAGRSRRLLPHHPALPPTQGEATADLKIVLSFDIEPRGLFATRAPSRPNPIGLSVVRLLGIEGNEL